MNIDLDFNASTPVAPEVAARLQTILREPFGNPSSGHWAARPAREFVERARAQVASLLGCGAGEVVFTSGGSEANNHALKVTFIPFPAGIVAQVAKAVHDTEKSFDRGSHTRLVGDVQSRSCVILQA